MDLSGLEGAKIPRQLRGLQPRREAGRLFQKSIKWTLKPGQEVGARLAASALGAALTMASAL